MRLYLPAIDDQAIVIANGVMLETEKLVVLPAENKVVRSTALSTLA